jgi:hypothetical protein
MGNGYTFALETAIFTAIVYAVERTVWGRYKPCEHAIFGDDIIIRRSLFGHVVTLLRLSGFTLNTEKSFFQGPVRESCGTDWFDGHPVRPIFLSSQPKTVMDLYTDYNRLKRNLTLNWGEGDYEVLRRILKWIPAKYRAIQGPLSDTDFSSFLHTDEPCGKLLGWVMYHPVLVVQIRRLRRRQFLLGRLAHNLCTTTPTIQDFNPWHRIKVGGYEVPDPGSRFIRFARNRYRVVLTTSSCLSWQEDYHR